MTKRKFQDRASKSTKQSSARNGPRLSDDRFPYRPLADPKRQIRILVIEPGTGPSTVIGHFETRRLADRNSQGSAGHLLPYEALSYAWGEVKENSTIRLGMETPNANRYRSLLYQVTVTETLEKCLKRLRDSNKERRIWVDNLCINQLDHDEKSDQVGIMGSIYRQAEQVCIWLGTSTLDTKSAFSLIQEIIQIDAIGHAIDNPEYTSRWRAFGALLRRKWFSRRWIVQEIALARNATVYCGADSMSWDDFSKGVAHYESRSEDILRTLKKHEEQEPKETRRSRASNGNTGAIAIEVQALGAHSLINTLQQLFRRGSMNEISEYLLPLDALMSMLTNFNVSNSKDIIYAVRTLAKDFQEPDWCGNGPSIIASKKKGILVPNYNQTTLDVYLEFIKYVIKTTKRLDIICIPWAPSLNGDEAGIRLPSWITPVSKRPFSQHDDGNGYFSRDNADTLVGRADDRMYNVSGHTAAEKWIIYKDERNHPRLVVKGRKIGDIKILGDAAQKGWVPFKWLDMALEVEERRRTRASIQTRILQNSTRQGNTLRQTRRSTRLAESVNQSRASVTNVSEPTQTGKQTAPPTVEIPDAFWRTLVADRGPKSSNLSNPPPWYETACKNSFARRTQYLKTGDIITKALCNRKGIMKDTLEFQRRVQATTWNRKFMVTERDSIGLAPAEAQERDMICMLWGCSVPVILRDLGGKKCQLIGECYVHGIMHGEFLEKHSGIEDLQDELNREFDII